MATRHERVVLDLEDRLSSGMVKAAAATKLLDKELNSLSGQAVRSNRSVSDSERELTKAGNSAERSGKQIDKLSGRMALLAQTALVLGPALIPLGAAGIPAVAGLATELGVAAAAAGVAVLAFHGLGDGLKALNAYQLDPTVENLAKMRDQMDKLGPAGAHFVHFLDRIGPDLKDLQYAARDGLFPGMEDGIKSLLTIMPQVKVIVGDLATAMGHLAADTGAALSGSKFRPFFDYLEQTAGPTLEALGHTLGNFASGFANMIVAFGPLSSQFVNGFEGMSRAFANWAAHLDTNQGFQDFLDYLQSSGPKALDFLGALVQAFAGIVKAAAPLGNTVLPILTDLAKGLGALADSPVGPMFFTAAASMILFSRGAKVVEAAMGGLNVKAERTTTAMNKLRSAGMALAGLEAAGAALDMIEKKAAGAAPSVDKVTEALIHVNNADFAAQFDGIGQALADIDKGGVDGVAQSLENLGEKGGFAGKAVAEGLGTMVGLGDDMQLSAVQADKASAAFDSLDQALAGVVASGSPDQARAMFANLAESQHLTADQQAKLLTLLPKYGDALTAAKNQIDLAAGATSHLGDQLGGAGRAAKRASEQIMGARTAAAKTASSFITLGDSLNDSKVSLHDWITQLQQQANALRDFADNAKKAAKRGLDDGLIKSLQEAGPEGAMRMKQLANATDSELARANKSWRSGQKAIKDYTTTVGGVPSAVATTLSVHDLATMKARALKRELDSIDTHIDIYFQAHTTRLPSTSGMGPQVPSARGNLFAGDIANGHQPELAGPGLTRVWREPETQGEAYIPLANDSRRPRARAIAAETVKLLGGAAYFDQGGVVSGPNVPKFTGWGPSLEGNGRTVNMALHYFETHLQDAGKGLERLGNHLLKELTERQNLLKAELDREKQRLDMLKQERAALASQISQAFHTDMFGGSGGVDVQALTDAGLSPDVIAQMQLTQQHNALTSGIADKKEALRLLKILRQRGLNGQAFINLAATGDVATLRAYVDMSKSDLMQYERLYNQDAKLEKRLGSYVGDQQFGAAIKAQSHDVHETRMHLQKVTHQLADVTKELREIKKIEARQAKEHAHHTAAAVNGAAAAAARKGR